MTGEIPVLGDPIGFGSGAEFGGSEGGHVAIGFVNGQKLATSGVTGNPACTTDALPETSVGRYPIFCGPGTLAAANYQFVFASGSLDVTPATLTVRADDKTRPFGAANPELTATITGFVNGETLETSGVTGSAACTTPATPASPAGDFAITCSAGSLAATNYTFTLEPGTLTIAAEPTTTSVPNASATYSEQTVSVGVTAAVTRVGSGSPAECGAVTFTIEDGAATIATSAPAAVASGAASATLTLPAGTPVGTYSIHAAYEPGAGLAASAGTATLTVGKRATTIASGDASASFGATSVTIQATVAASPGGSSTVDAGTVTFTVKRGATTIGTPTTSTAVAGGAVSVSYALPAGTAPGAYTFEAAYGGTGNFAASAAAPKTLTIGAAPTSLAVSATPNPVQYSDRVTLTAAVSPSAFGDAHATGTVEFRLDGSVVGSASVDATGVATLDLAMTLPAGTHELAATLSSSSAGFAGSSGTAGLPVAAEDATLVYGGDDLGRTASALTLQATFTDSAAASYAGANPELGPTATFGDITAAYVAFDLYTGPACTGTPIASPVARVVDTGAAGDGIGTATATFAAAAHGTYCVRPRLVAADGSPNLFYTAEPAATSAVEFRDDLRGSVAGTGWPIKSPDSFATVSVRFGVVRGGQPLGLLTYHWRGVYQGVPVEFVVTSKTLTALSFHRSASALSATIQGRADLQIVRLRDNRILYTSLNGSFVAVVQRRRPRPPGQP